MKPPLRRFSRSAVCRASREMGGEMKEIHFSMGPYDDVVIAEAPAAKTFTCISLAVSAQCKVRTTSFRAFTEGEALDLAEGMR